MNTVDATINKIDVELASSFPQFAELSAPKPVSLAETQALLVSHWPVVSDAAVAITTRMLKEARKPGIGRSEAHRLAMMALIEDTDHPHYAHPMFWAPFVVVGEGGAALG